MKFQFNFKVQEKRKKNRKVTTLYLGLAAALYHLRAVTHRPTPPIGNTGIPLESEYSDDVEFINTSKEELEHLLPVVIQVFNEWNLQINESKMEFVYFRIAGNPCVNLAGKVERRKWARKGKVLTIRLPLLYPSKTALTLLKLFTTACRFHGQSIKLKVCHCKYFSCARTFPALYFSCDVYT
jgi:hypothetical protein